MLYSFIDTDEDICFVKMKKDLKLYLARCFYNIGTQCIENDFEEGVRKVSNAIGWSIISSIKDSTQDLTKYLIDRAEELYYLSRKMEVSQKTKVFLLTLFTTVGTYCCKEYNRSLLNRILDAIKHEDIERIRVAIKLRTSENDMWDDLFDGQTQQLSQKFYDMCKKKDCRV